MIDGAVAGGVLAGWMIVALSMTFLGGLALLAEEFIRVLDNFLNPPQNRAKRGRESRRGVPEVSSTIRHDENDSRAV